MTHTSIRSGRSASRSIGRVPVLLRRVGIDTDALIADNIATYKKKIVVCERGKTEWRAAPPPVIRRLPLRFETVTLHVDRTALDTRLFDHACALGAEFIWERVTDIQTDGDWFTGCATAAVGVWKPVGTSMPAEPRGCCRAR